MARDKDAAVAFFNPDTATSGIIDDINLTITDAELVEYDFNGKAVPRNGKSGNVLALHLTLEDDDGSQQDGPFAYFPCGAIEDFVPSDDGKEPVPTTGKTGFNKRSAGIQLMNAFIKTGVPKNKMSSRVDFMIGYKFHWKQTEKEGAQEPTDGGMKKTLLLPDRLISAPGEKAGKAGKAAKPASKAAAAASDDEGDDASAKAIELVKKVLANADGAVDIETVGSEVFDLAMKDKAVDKAQRKAILNLVGDADFFSENAGKKTWAFDEDAGTVEAP